ncbi:hypothetical protein HN51_017520, partial [Arachis hypogaea]
MKKERVPYPGVVRPRFKPNTRPNNKIEPDASIQRRQLWTNIKARLKYNLDFYDWLRNKVRKYENGTKSITKLSSDAAVLMRGHPDLINEFNKWIPMTPQDSCTLLSHHLAATHLENRDLQDKGLDEISFDSYSDPDTETEDNDWISWVTSFTKLGRYTDRFNFWKKMK